MRPCHPCVPLDLCSLLARPLLDMCYRGVSLHCKQSRTSYLRVSARLPFPSRRCMRDMFAYETKKHTHSLIYRLLSLSLSHTYSFCTLTHSPSHALDLSRLRHSPPSIAHRFIEKSNITKFDHVHGEKELHLVRQTYTIRFTMRCSFVWCIFGIVDINNICVNLIKVSKVWLLKNLHALHYRADGISLSPSQLSDAPLSLIGAPQSLSNFISPWFTHTHVSLALYI